MDGYVYTPDEGDAYDWRGARIVLKAAAEQTLGQLAVMESAYPPGLVVPTHFHQGEDEMSTSSPGICRCAATTSSGRRRREASCSCPATIRTASPC